MSGSSPTLILTHRYIAYPVQAILNAPVPSIQIEQVLGISSIRPQACNCVRHIGHPLIADDPRSLDANRLGKARPVEIATESTAALKMANLNSPVPFVYFTNLVKLLTAKAFAVGGKGRD